MIFQINTIADPGQRQILTTKAKRNENMADAVELAKDLRETAKASESTCVGLAANQIWADPAQDIPHVFVMSDKGVWRAFINAHVHLSGDRITQVEGCMSMPGVRKLKVRRTVATLEYFDEAGSKHTEVFKGFPATVIQHEMDHLKGELL